MALRQRAVRRSPLRMKRKSLVQDDNQQLAHSRTKESPVIQQDNWIPSSDSFDPATLLHLQTTVGNHAVQRMLKQRGAPAIQREFGKEDVVTTGENMVGQISNIGDMVGNEKGFNQTMQGGIVGSIGAVGGMGLGAAKIGMNAQKIKAVNAELEQAQLLAKTEQGMQATITLLERKKVAAQKGIAEGSGSIFGGISGFINAFAGLFSANTAQLVSKVAGPVGSGFAIIIGTIAAIRDFMNVHKRRKAKEAIGAVIGAYSGLADGLSTEMKSKSQEIESTLASVTPENASETSTKLHTLSTEFEALETRFDNLDKMRISLAVAERKQGSGGKVMSGITNLVGVGGAGALLALGLGALGVAGVGAAAGPVGWALVGVAAVAALSYFIGVKVKQAIRKSNVTRMNEEITLVDEFINTGKVSGQPVTLDGGADATTITQQERLAAHWKRSMFPTVEKKGWFNKLISKSKSGKLTIAERKQELVEYLAKYDKEAASNTVWEGFKRALLPGEEGDMMVDNPAFDPKKPNPSVPQKITLRQQIENLITFYFGAGKVADFVKSIQAGGSKEQGARSLLMQKMKLEDK